MLNVVCRERGFYTSKHCMVFTRIISNVKMVIQGDTGMVLDSGKSPLLAVFRNH